jgi:TolB-like protein
VSVAISPASELRLQPSRQSRARARLAVLPFGPCDAFTEGLTEEAMAQLTQASPRTLGVVARTSVERAQRDGGGAAAIGRALSADYLIEGHVRRDGDRVRITAQLIESQDETHLWSKTFDRVMTDMLSVQIDVAEDIAKAVADALSTAKRASA